MTAKRWWVAVVAAALLLTAAACSRARSDAQIAGEVVTRINSDPQVTNKQVTVTSNRGVVTLSGAAASDAERAAAANDAAQVEGVKTVVNNLTPAVAQPAPEQQASLNEQAKPVEPPAPAHRRKPAAYRTRERAVDYRPAVSPAPATAPAPVEMANASVTPAPVSVAPTPPAPEPPKPISIPSGTTLSVRMIDSIDTGRNQPGDMFHASLYSPITIDDQVVIPEGADVTGRIVELKDAGRFAGQPQVALELASLSMNGRSYTIVTDRYTQQGPSRGARTAKTVGSGAAIGAIIGAIAGGGKGAAIGAATGAGVGGGVEAATKPKQVHIAPEALLSFRLQSPLTVTPVATVQRNHMNTSWSAPPPRNNIIDYSDNSTSDRPVLRRRAPANTPEQPQD
jgi:hypothetical protein